MDNEEVVVDDEQVLIPVPDSNQKKAKWKESIILKTTTFGLNGFLFAAHLVLNGKFLSLLTEDGPAASALMSTYQSVVLGGGLGCLLGTGLDFGNAVGEKNFRKAGDIAKTSVLLSTAIGALVSGAMVATKGMFPVVFDAGTARVASDFFLGYAASAPLLLFLIVGPQIAFQEGDWYIPPACMLSVLLLSGGASALLGFQFGMGALGVGLGGTFGSLVTTGSLIAWSQREHYKKYEFYKFRISEFTNKVKSLLSSGWKLSLQRLTEWGNLLAITTIIGAISNDELRALNPSMLYLVMFGTTLQGFAQAAGMVISKHKGEIKKAISDNNSEEVVRGHENNIKAIFRSNMVGFVLNATTAGLFYLGREPLSEFFLSKTDEELALAENLLWLNMVGLIPDAFRIVGAGALRGWKDLLYPTLISFLFMTVIAIPTACGVGAFLGDTSEAMIYARDLAMLVSAIFILKKCHTNIKQDEKTDLSEYVSDVSFFKTGFSFNLPCGRKSEEKVERLRNS